MQKNNQNTLIGTGIH